MGDVSSEPKAPSGDDATGSTPGAVRRRGDAAGRLPLDGITVVALEQAVSAPFATRQLADLGARVIKVERAGGDFARHYDETVKGMSAYFVWCNRGKESVTLDLKAPDDRALLDRIIAKSDVVVQNLAPGAVERLGLGADALRERDPRLIVCGISGYGTTGPYRNKKAFDLLLQCETGLVSLTGTPDDPARAGISTADVAAGMYGFSGVLAALFERERTGVGSAFDVAMVDALGEWLGHPLYSQLYGGTALPRSGARHPSIAPYGHYRTGDAGQVFLCAQSHRDWVDLCEKVLHRPDLIDDPRFADNPLRVANDTELTRAIEQCFGSATTDEVMAALEEAGIANARLRTIGEFIEHPQHVARDRWREFDSPVGPLHGLLPPISVHGSEPAMGPVPALGEHDAAIREEFSP